MDSRVEDDLKLELRQSPRNICKNNLGYIFYSGNSFHSIFILHTSSNSDSLRSSVKISAIGRDDSRRCLKIKNESECSERSKCRH